MRIDARRAIIAIRACIEGDRFSLAVHFSERMSQRGIFWPDVQRVIGDANEAMPLGKDKFGRPKWVVRGEVMRGDRIEIVCAIEIDESETEFITLYWQE
jgi:hypothetical protein